MLIDFLKDESYFAMGSSTFDLPNYKAKDIDVCILCNNTNVDHNRIIKKLEQYDDSVDDCGVNYIANYVISFDWGGKTTTRLEIGKYDFFLVDENTFKVIKKTNKLLQQQPPFMKKLMLHKQFRVELFQLIARELYTKIRRN